jgi:hypothetical protein
VTFKYGKHSIITQESAIFPIKMFVSCSCYIVAIRKIPWSTFNLEKRLKTKKILLLNLYLDTLSQRYATFLDHLTLLDRNGPSCFPLRQGNLLLLPPPLSPPPPQPKLLRLVGMRTVQFFIIFLHSFFIIECFLYVFMLSR